MVILCHSYCVSSFPAPYAVIPGPSVVRVVMGGTLTLECSVHHLHRRPPSALFWRHDGVVVTAKSGANSGRVNGGLSLESERNLGESHIRLVVVGLNADDAGHYECVTDVADPARVEVIVGEREGALIPADAYNWVHLHRGKLVVLCRAKAWLGSCSKTF